MGRAEEGDGPDNETRTPGWPARGVACPSQHVGATAANRQSNRPRLHVPEILAIDHAMALAAQRLEEGIDRLAMLTEDSAEARALLPQQGKWTESTEARPCQFS
jgi:hypothetical protein